MFMECYFFYTFCNFIKNISFYVLKIIRFLLLLFLRDLFSFKNGRIQGYYICVYHFLSKEPDSLGSGNNDCCVDYTPGRTFISNKQFFFKVFFFKAGGNIRERPRTSVGRVLISVQSKFFVLTQISLFSPMIILYTTDCSFGHFFPKFLRNLP